MKARTKIQLITTVFAIATALVFSAGIFWELVEQPVRLIDRELYEVKEQLTGLMSSLAEASGEEPVLLETPPFDKYGIQVFSPDNRLIARTKLAEKASFNFRRHDNYYFKSATVDMDDLRLTEADRREIDAFSRGKVYFRVYNTSIARGNDRLEVLISRPIPVLVHEIKDLLTSIVISLAICCLTVPFVAWLLARRILRPLSEINKQVEEITGTSLNRRIPLSGSRDELQVLSASLNKMFDRLEFSFDRQREFIGNASHDLKSPLTSLRLGLENLISEDLPRHIQLSIEKHLNTTRRISRLVHNLLELSRLEQHEPFKLVEVDLEKAITSILEDFKELLVAQGISVTVRFEHINIMADQEKIARVIINLLDNAVKYNLPENGQIGITLTREKEWAMLEIANTGKTIPEDSLPLVFDQFYRVEKSRSSEFGGSGLGLTIVRHIVELHRGHITVHNSPAAEVVFRVHLPL
jgi:two-component system OmpR family sensor kinase